MADRKASTTESSWQDGVGYVVRNVTYDVVLPITHLLILFGRIRRSIAERRERLMQVSTIHSAQPSPHRDLTGLFAHKMSLRKASTTKHIS
jgi:hypothetical protein